MKVDNAIKNMAVAMFHSYCNQLATLVNDQLFDGCRDWSWIGDEVGACATLKSRTFYLLKIWCAY